MNTNSFAASLTDGYGRPVSSAMLDALGITEDRPVPMPKPRPARDFCKPARRVAAANGNARVASSAVR
jgi:hypothetical protein